jgi:putative phosphoesterase
VLVALIADTHVRSGTPLLPPRCLELVARSDLVIHAGDMADLRALERLQAIGPPVVAVQGNVDDAALAAFLHEVALVTTDGCTIAAIHDAGPGRGRLERMRRRFPSAVAVVFGHSHVPFHEVAPDGFQIFNPGSPTLRRRQPRHTMGLATVCAGAVSFELVPLD